MRFQPPALLVTMEPITQLPVILVLVSLRQNVFDVQLDPLVYPVLPEYPEVLEHPDYLEGQSIPPSYSQSSCLDKEITISSLDLPALPVPLEMPDSLVNKYTIRIV